MTQERSSLYPIKALKCLSIALAWIFVVSDACAYQQNFIITNSFTSSIIHVSLQSAPGGEANVEAMDLSGPPSKSCIKTTLGNWLISAGATCNLVTNGDIGGGWRVCADYSSDPQLKGREKQSLQSGGLNCWDGKHTRIEVTSSSPGTNLDISVVPHGSINGVACNDPQWAGCPYYNTNKIVSISGMGTPYCSQLNPNQPEASQCQSTPSQKTVVTKHCSGIAISAYNIGVAAGCQTNTNNYNNRLITMTCKGSPSLGEAKYPSNCGYTSLSNPPSTSCIGDGGVNCMQAFFSPMSNAGNNTPSSVYTNNGFYYCGYQDPYQQPDITCSSQLTPIYITFSNPNVSERGR